MATCTVLTTRPTSGPTRPASCAPDQVEDTPGVSLNSTEPDLHDWEREVADFWDPQDSLGFLAAFG